MQIDLFGATEEAAVKDHCLFLAVMPELPAGEAILEYANLLSGGQGALRPLGHLHVSLHGLGHFAEVPERLVRMVGLACTEVAGKTAPFDITFDRVMRYGGGSLVMAEAAADNAPLKEMYRALGRELLMSGATKSISKSFNPHVTMLYGAHEVQDQAMRPFTWAAREIVLIDSWQGKTQYTVLGRWALGVGAASGQSGDS